MLISVRRHHVQQIKVALPVILKVARTISSDFDGEDEVSLLDLFRAVIGIGISIQSICDKSVCEVPEDTSSSFVFMKSPGARKTSQYALFVSSSVIQ